jgi:hypothetical protein
VILQNQIDKYLKRRTINGCVYRLTYGGKFIIVKGKTLAGSLFQVQKGFGWFTDNMDNALYSHFYKHIKSNPGKKFTVRVLLHSSNPYNLLKREQKELDMGRYNPNMLNNSLEAYIPIYNEFSGKYGWIDKVYIMNFQKHLKSPTRAARLKEYKRSQPLMLAKRGSLSRKY